MVYRLGRWRRAIEQGEIMSKVMKTIFYTLTVLALLLLVAVGAIVVLVDPNDYKDDITGLVQDTTGRELILTGDIELSLFPWLGLSLGEAQLSNAKGFGDTPFASVQRVEIKVRLLPLLQKQLQMQALRLHGLRIQLAKNAAGVSNWDDLLAAKEPAAEQDTSVETGADSGAMPLAALAIGGLEIVDAHLEWDDRQAGQQVLVDKLNLSTGPVSLQQPVEVRLAMDVGLAQPALQNHVEMSGQLLLDPDVQAYRVNNLQLQIDASGESLPASPLTLAMTAEVLADLASDKLAIDALHVKAMDLALEGQLTVDQLQAAPQVQAKLMLASFSPRALMSALAIAVPETSDTSVLSRAQATIELSASAAGAELHKLDLQLDETRINGTASVANFQQPALEFDFSLDEIDVDRYLPPGTQSAPPTPSAAAAGATQLPLAPLRQLNAVGQIRAGKLKIANARLSELLLGFRGQAGQLRLRPAQAKLYGGSYNGNIGLDVRTDTPRISLQEKLSSIHLGPLLKDVLGDDALSGTGNVTAVVTARGVDPEQLKKTLNGSASLSLRDGALKGVNLGQMIREANAKLKNQAPPPKTSNQTDFAELSASVRIKNGVLSNDDLQLKSPLLRIGGKGMVDLPREQIDYLVNTSIVGTDKGQAGEDLASLKALTIPVKVSGSFAAPSFSLELEPLLKAKLEQELARQKARAKQQLEEKTEQRKEELQQNLRQKLKDKLKKLF